MRTRAKEKSIESVKLSKYELYERAVQNPKATLDFVRQTYRAINRRHPRSLREDFCGTGLLAVEWVKRGSNHTAVGVDVDGEPLEIGRIRHLSRLSVSQSKRVQLLRRDARRAGRERFDVILALNYSYWVFKRRAELLAYFRSVRRSLRVGGCFFIDLFGGSRAQDERTRKFAFSGFDYWFQCQAFNPVASEGVFAIHFKAAGQGVVRNAFVYSWRMWGCAELREMLLEAGFSAAVPYFEGDAAPGKAGGDEKFTATEWEDNCAVWRAYLVGSV